MTNFTDLDRPTKPVGEPPDEHPRFGPVLIEWCHEEALKRDAEWEANHAERPRFYHSDAGACSRAIAYAALRMRVSNPMDPQSHYNLWLGNVIHEAFQTALQRKYPDAEIEVRVTWEQTGCRIDAVVKLEAGGPKPYVISIEAKSIGGYGYKLASAKFNGPPEGPKFGNKMQGFLNAKRIDADEAVVILFSKDPNNWVEEGLDPMLKVTAEWTYTREQYRPLADKEDERIATILKMVDEGTLPRRFSPEVALEFPKHIIVEPSTGAYLVPDEAGNWAAPPVKKPYFWGCAYCRYQPDCAKTGADREPVSRLVEIGALPGGGHGEGEAREQ